MKNLWYLSPSDQTDNTGINGYGTEEAQMNALLDVITPPSGPLWRALSPGQPGPGY